jgi:membrane protein
VQELGEAEVRTPLALWNAVNQRLKDRWRALKVDRPGVGHAADAYRHYKDHHGDHLAAAITYFSFLALFPLIFLAVSVAGFILTAHPNLIIDIKRTIDQNVPGGFGNTLKDTIDYGTDNRAKVGLLGLIGVAWTGLGWVGNLRRAIDTVWGSKPLERNFLVAKALDALVLVGLGIGVAISIGLTAFGTAASKQAIHWIGWTDNSGTALAIKIVGIMLAILGDLLVFGWLLIRLPQVRVSRRTAVRATLLAAVGLEILKIVGAYYLARLAQSPAAAVLGAVIGILIFLDLVSRYLLYCVAWAATAERTVASAAPAQIELPLEPIAERGAAVSPLAVAAGLLSAGAAVGGAAVAALLRRRDRARARERPTR